MYKVSSTAMKKKKNQDYLMLDGNIIEYFFAVAKLSTHYWPHPDEQNQALQEWTK
jgi:hypothetical protein